MNGRSCRLLLLFVLIVCLFLRRTETVTRRYSQRLRTVGWTLPSNYEVFESTDKFRCASLCNVYECDGAAWDEMKKECRIFKTLSMYVAPVQTSEGPLVTMLLENTHVIFITVLNNDNLFWASAKSECEARGETMKYIPEEAEALKLFDENGSFYVGLNRVNGTNSTWIDLSGNNKLEESAIHWDVSAGQPQRSNDTLCMARSLRSGYHDVICNSRNSSFPKVAFCTFTKY